MVDLWFIYFYTDKMHIVLHCFLYTNKVFLVIVLIHKKFVCNFRDLNCESSVSLHP